MITAALVFAAFTDCRVRRIPNGVSLLILVCGCIARYCLSDIPGLWLALEGIGVGFLLALPLYLFAGLGGGDVKLLAAGGALSGPELIVQVAVWSAVFGGAGAVLVVIVSPLKVASVRRWFGRARPASALVIAGADPGQRRMPMAPVVALGMLVVILQSAEFARIFAVRDILDLIRCTA